MYTDGYHCAGESRTVLYTCCRDGNKREHTGPSKTGKTRKHRQSRRLENYCIARTIATEDQSEGRVEVKYISTHTNHELTVTECRHLPRPNSVRKDICQQFVAYRWKESWTVCMHTQHIATSLYVHNNYTDVRGSIGKRDQRMNFTQNVTREQFVTRQDCRFNKKYIVQPILHQNFTGTYAVN